MDKDKISRKYAINQIEIAISISEGETKEYLEKVKDFIMVLPCIEELDKHVYCTDCQNFILNNKSSDVEIDCKYAGRCWFYNPEDSVPRYKRLCWSPKETESKH